MIILVMTPFTVLAQKKIPLSCITLVRAKADQNFNILESVGNNYSLSIRSSPTKRMVRIKYYDARTDSNYCKIIDANRAILPVNSILKGLGLKRLPKNEEDIKIISVDNKSGQGNIVMMEGADEIIYLSSLSKSQGSKIINGFATLHNFDTTITVTNTTISVNLDLSFIKLTSADQSQHIVVDDISSISAVETTRLSNLIPHNEKAGELLEQDQEMIIITGRDEFGLTVNKWLWPSSNTVTDDLGVPILSRTDSVLAFYKDKQVSIINKTAKKISTYPYNPETKTIDQAISLKCGDISVLVVSEKDTTDQRQSYWYWPDGHIKTRELGQFVSRLEADSSIYLFLDWGRAYMVNTKNWTINHWSIDQIQSTDSTGSLEKFYGHLFYDRDAQGKYRIQLRVVYDQKNDNGKWIVDKMYTLSDPNLTLDSSLLNKPLK